MLCALIKENIVIDVQDLSISQIDAIGSIYEAIVDITGYEVKPMKGWVYDGAILAPSSWRITRLGMRQRFTFSELCALTTAADTDVRIKVLIVNLQAAEFVDLKRADTVGGINMLVGLGLITSARATAILTTPPNPTEAYQG